MAKKELQSGPNRTGVQTAPKELEKMLAVMNTKLAQPTSQGDASALAELRARYIAEADVVGTVPPPGGAKGAPKAGAKAAAGKHPPVFLDKLAERLAFERSGTRLYDALIGKVRAEGRKALPLEELEKHRAEEAAHFKLVMECIEKLGADPTAQTPGADVVGIEGSGLMQVITAPQTTLAQSLHALLVAELTDNAAWEELVALAKRMGEEEMAARFAEAGETERRHLQEVKKWHQQLTMKEADA